MHFELEAYKLSQTLLQNAILDCEPAVLARALDALNITDTILKVYDRIEQHATPTTTATDNSSSCSGDGGEASIKTESEV